MNSSRPTLRDLKAECQKRGISTATCLERADLERLLQASPSHSAGSISADTVPVSAAVLAAVPDAFGLSANTKLEDVSAELDSWVIYPPRALALLEQLKLETVSAGILKKTRLGLIMGRYKKHPDDKVAMMASELISKWKKLVFDSREPASHSPRLNEASTEFQEKALRHVPSRQNALAHAVARLEKEESGTSEEETTCSSDALSDNEDDASVGCTCWSEKPYTATFNRKEQHFRVLTLTRPFDCSKWKCRIRIAEEYYKPEARDLLDQMARDFGASKAGEDCSAEEKQMLQRLKRLEERFRGNGVTDGEARNAMRLFERELSKANWTEDKFLKLKRQLEGAEDLSLADQVAEGSLLWTAQGQRRQAWFSDACQRIAAPLGLEFGFTENGGCCFAGPLSATVGAVLTSALVCHLADLDLERARSQRGASRLSVPQFMQGFVDGALDIKRHLVWEKIFSIEDDCEAARFCQTHVDSGFFDDEVTCERDARSHVDSDGNGDELSSLLRGLFSSDGVHRNEVPRDHHPRSFTPFTGSGRRMSDGSDVSKQECSASASWALTFASNLQLVRSSRHRSSTEAQKVYRWGRSARAVKATQTGTESYSKGKLAGEKRKTQIDGTVGTTSRKYKSQKLALTR